MTDLTINAGLATTAGPANIKWLSRKRQMEGRVSIHKNGVVSFQASGHNLEVWRSVFPDCKVVSEDVFEEFTIDVKRPDFVFKREPQQHQSTAFEKLKNNCYTAIFGAVGSGKSKIISDLGAAYWCAGKIDAIIVVSLNFLIAAQWHETQLDRDLAIPHVS